jgi:hypothetical protein
MKRLPYTITAYSVFLAIPKKRGEGFLKVPVGPFNNELKQFVDDEIKLDCDGLDGYLAVHFHGTRYSHGTLTDVECRERIVDPLAKYLDATPEHVLLGQFFDILQGKQS